VPQDRVLLEQRLSHLIDERGALEGCYKRPSRSAFKLAAAVAIVAAVCLALGVGPVYPFDAVVGLVTSAG
jgi:hypothetical protein